MAISIDGSQAVPIVVTNTTIWRDKKVRRKRRFLGLTHGFKKLAYRVGHWALDKLEDVFFEDEVEVLDEGRREEQHFAIIVGLKEDHSGYELQAVPVDYRPACIHHYEIVRYASDDQDKLARMTGRRPDADPAPIDDEMREAIRRAINNRLQDPVKSDNGVGV